MVKGIKGNQVFEYLSKLSEEERANCVFPCFFTKTDYDSIISNSYMDLDDTEYDKALEVTGEEMAQMTAEAIDDDEAVEMRGAFVDFVYRLVNDKLCKLVRK